MPEYTQAGAVGNEDDLDEGKKEGNKTMTVLIAVFIVLIWIAIFILLVKLDVGGFGSSVLYPVLKDVPVLNAILPETEESASIDSNTGDTYTTLQQAINRINELEAELAVYRANADANAERISALTAEVARLEEYEDNQTTYETLKRKFDEEIVYTDNAPDITEYASWYEKMDPDNAAEIYRQVQEQLAIEATVQELANYYAAMKPAAAAAIFEEMTGDLEKVAEILSAMKPAVAGDILAAMDSTLAAKLTLLIYPVTE